MFFGEFKDKVKKFNLGFTLAEVLITLCTIGVISSMTIPVLLNNINDAQYKAAWKKDYSDISQASKRTAIHNGGSLSGAFGSNDFNHDSFRNELLRYLNYTKLCNVDTAVGPDGCWHDGNSWYKLSGPAIGPGGNWPYMSRAILNNGVLLAFFHNSAECVAISQGEICGQIWVDINGYKKPNTVGKDIFSLYVLKDGNVIPEGIRGGLAIDDPWDYSCDIKAYPTTIGWNCSAEFLR